MLHYMTHSAQPLKFATCGKFVSTLPWRHPDRNLNTFVLLFGREGTLHIEQSGRRYEMKKGNVILLLPGHPHTGCEVCEPGLAYYWCHFFSREKEVHLLEADEMRQQVMLMNSSGFSSGFSDVYLLPEFGRLDSEERVSILFHQLLDYANSGCYSSYFMDYTLSLLAMEISRQCIDNTMRVSRQHSSSDQRLYEIMEWIRLNRELKLTAQDVAEKFNYNPDYLSSLFRQVTGYPLLKYIHRVKMAAARQLLLQQLITVREVAAQTGYDDEKHFMKVFRQYEGMTPSQYRNAFVKTHMNKR